VLARGWNESQWNCLSQLWQKESEWNPTAKNSSSGAYGIPQALPGSKMATAGSDWATNPATQIKWGLDYIKGRYGSPCGAWNFWLSHNWY
jgi:membrane-bound lytic murein transglycosylase MltF